MKVDRRVFLLAMCSTPAALAGCGGGGGNAGTGGFLAKSLGLGGTFRGQLTRAVNDLIEMDISLNNGTVSGVGRLTAAVGSDISAGEITGTFSGTQTSGLISFSIGFETGNLANQTLTMSNASYTGSSNGSTVTVTVTGPYTIGAETGNVTLSKISDVTADVTGHWTGNAISSVNGANVALTADFMESLNHLTGSGSAGTNSFSITGLIIADKITYGALGSLPINFTASVTGANSTATMMSGTYSGSDSGTFTLVRSASSS